MLQTQVKNTHSSLNRVEVRILEDNLFKQQDGLFL
jgi:hypothetical protein